LSRARFIGVQVGPDFIRQGFAAR